MPIATRSDIIDLSSETKTEELANIGQKPRDLISTNGSYGRNGPPPPSICNPK